MPKLMGTLLCLVILLSISIPEVQGQDSSRLDRLINSPDKFFGLLDKKTKEAEDRLTKQMDRYLSKLQKQEQRLKKQLARKDSAKAEEVFGDINKRYTELKNTTGKTNQFSQVYSGHLDSLSTAVSFLKGQQVPGIASSDQLQKTLAQ